MLRAPQAAVPFMPTPPQNIVGFPAIPPAPAASTQPPDILFPGPVSAADQVAAPIPAGGGALAPALGASFQGLADAAPAINKIPPDTMGAVGPNHVMTMLNTQVRIQNRAGGIISTVSLPAFWAGAGAGTPFDPHVVYDTLSGRWIATCDAAAKSATSRVFFAISATSNPTGAWTFYSFVADATGVTWADYPGFGVNSKWIAITNNMFPVAGGAGVGAKMWVIDKSTALAGGALTVTVFATAFTSGFTLKPAVTFDAAEPNMYIVDNGWSAGAGAIDYFRLSRITGTAAAPVWSVVPDAAGPFPGQGLADAVQRYNNTQVDAAQLGSANLIESNDRRIINAVFRNGHLWFTHSGGFPNESVGVATRTDIFWYQVNPLLLNTTGLPVVQSGTNFATATANSALLFPSIAVNKNNDAAIGFTLVHSGRYAAAWVIGRASTDPLGTMIGAGGFSLIAKTGLAPYFKTFGGPRNRWGDYSATMVDPVNQTDFWTLQEYAELPVGTGVNKDRWATWWAQVRMGKKVPNDFNGDGKSDILYHNPTTGKNFMRMMNGRAVLSQGNTPKLPAVWQIAGNGDYNGDGKSDILYHNPTTGKNFMRMMNGRAVLSQGNAPALPAAWSVVFTN
jgi:hypothetical protein